MFHRHPQVPLVLYEWAYFDAAVLQRCFPQLFRTTRTAQDYLRRWRESGHVKSARPGYQHQQHLHSLTPAAITFLSTHFRRAFPVSAAGVRSPFLIEHERTVSHFQTDLYTAINDRPDLSVPIWLRRFGVDRVSTLSYHDAKGERLLKPDLAFLLVRQLPDGRQRPLLHTVEIDRGTESMSVVKRKLLKYQQWYDQRGRDTLSRWYQPYGIQDPSFRLLVVTRHRDPAGDHFRQLVRWYTQALMLRPHLPLFISTLPDVEAYRRGGTDRTWYPLYRFRRPWLRRLAACRQVSQAYDYVADKLSLLKPRYAVLPPAD